MGQTESTRQQTDPLSALRHFAYKTAWKKLEPVWDWVIRLKRVSSFTHLLELVLSGNPPANPEVTERLPADIPCQSK